jgi:integrase
LSKTTLKHIKNLLSGVFRHAAQQGFFEEANPVTLAEIPGFAPRGSEGRAYSLEEIAGMLNVLSDPAATVVATAAYTGLRLGELRGLTWDAYEPAPDDDSFAMIHVRRSVWRGYIGEPKTEKSKAPVPVIPQLAERLEMFRAMSGNPANGPIFQNSRGKPLDLHGLYWREMKTVLSKRGIGWVGWHGFRRGLASNLNRLGVDDSIIQSILRHSTVAVTQNCYIKTVRNDAVKAMRKYSEELERVKCSPLCSPDDNRKAQTPVQ